MGTQTAEQKSTSTVSSTTKAISDTARQAMAYNAVIQAYISALKGTPDIDLSSITFPDADKHVIVDLPKHQQLARKNADFYKDGPTSPNAQVASTLSDIMGFGAVFTPVCDELLNMLDANGKVPADKVGEFDDNIDVLNEMIGTNKDNCDSIVKTLNSFTNLISADQRNLTGDHNIMSATLEGDNGELKKLQDEIDAINTAMDKDNAMIAGGAGMEVVGGLMIVVGAVCEFETGGVSTGLILAGVAVVGGGATMQGFAGKDLGDKMDELRDKMGKLCRDRKIVATLKQSTDTVGSLVSNIANAIQAISAIGDQWVALKADLNNVFSALKNAENRSDDDKTVRVLIKAAKTDWGYAADLAATMQVNGVLPVQNVGTYPAVSKAQSN